MTVTITVTEPLIPFRIWIKLCVIHLVCVIHIHMLARSDMSQSLWMVKDLKTEGLFSKVSVKSDENRHTNNGIQPSWHILVSVTVEIPFEKSLVKLNNFLNNYHSYNNWTKCHSTRCMNNHQCSRSLKYVQCGSLKEWIFTISNSHFSCFTIYNTNI